MSTWRFAGRLAWREVRRRPGRTALVALLVAVPVLAMTFVNVLARNFVEEDPFVTDRPAGVDIELSFVDAETVAPLLPDGAVAWTFANVGAPIQDVHGTSTQGVDIHELPDGRPRARILRPDGELPGPGEVWLSRNLLDELDVEVGDDLELTYPPGTWRVVGTGDLPFDARGMFVTDLDESAFLEDVQLGTLVDLPGDPTDAEVESTFQSLVAALGNTGGTHRGTVDIAAQSRTVLLWTWVAGAVGLAILGIVIAAAFATSARRQLVTVGLLASNGAPERTVSRALTLQGTWSGLVGSAVGVLGGWLALRTAQPWLEELAGPVEVEWSIKPLDVVVVMTIGILAATFAARLPARSAARVPVMAALAGRRPLGTVPPRLVGAGLAAFVVGVALLAAATTSGGGTGPALTAVIGAVVLLGGICCCTPLVTDVASRASSGVGRTWRLAGRSLGRTRARTAGVVTAIAVTAAGALAGAVGMAHLAGPPSDDSSVPRDLVEVVPTVAMSPGTSGGEAAPQADRAVDDEVRASVEAVAPGATWIPRQVVALDPAELAAAGDTSVLSYEDVLVATPELVDALRLSDENRALLAEADVLSVWPFIDPRPLVISSGGSQVQLEVVSAVLVEEEPLIASNGWYSAASYQGRGTSFLISPESVAAHGLETIDAGAIAQFPEPLGGDAHGDLTDAILGADAAMSMWYADAPSGDAGWMVSAAPYDTGMPSVGLIQTAIVGAALLLVLAVVAVGLALAATESRAERDVLVAVGARPRTLRTMAGAKAVVMTLAGVAVAVPGGLVPAFAVARAAHVGFTMPWLVLGGLVLVVPLVAGLAASGVSGLAQRLRPVRMSTLAVD